METLLRVGDVELCVETFGSPTDIPLLLIGTTVATWDDEFVERLTGRFLIRYALRDAGRGDPGATLLVLYGVRPEMSHGRFRNLQPNAENTKTIPMFTISRSQSWCLKKRTSTHTTTATSTST